MAAHYHTWYKAVLMKYLFPMRKHTVSLQSIAQGELMHHHRSPCLTLHSRYKWHQKCLAEKCKMNATSSQQSEIQQRTEKPQHSVTVLIKFIHNKDPKQSKNLTKTYPRHNKHHCIMRLLAITPKCLHEVPFRISNRQKNDHLNRVKKRPKLYNDTLVKWK